MLRFIGVMTLFLSAIALVVAGQLEPAGASAEKPPEAISGGGSESFMPVIMKAAPLCFRAVDGVVIGEVEMQTHPEWRLETEIEGYTGDGYYRWRGANYHTNPGNAVLRYYFDIEIPGAYNFRLRNYHDHPDVTEENDIWVSINGEPYIKAFSPAPPVWTHFTWYDFGHGIPQDADPTYNLAAGRHTLDLSPRSYGYAFDRFVFFLDGAWDGATLLPVSPMCDW